MSCLLLAAVMKQRGNFLGQHLACHAAIMLACGYSGAAFAQSNSNGEYDPSDIRLAADFGLDDGDEWVVGIPSIEVKGLPSDAGRSVKVAQMSPVSGTGQPVTPTASAEAMPRQVPEPANEGIFVGSITVTGSEALKTNNFNEIVEANVGQTLQEEDLRSITQQIADSARGQGYLFATARIPEQAIAMGILTIELDEGRIDDVRIVGSENSALQRLLAGLIGKHAIKQEVERKLVLANDIPKIIVKKTRFLKENGQNILEVIVKERKHRAAIEADNYGTDRFGPARAKLTVSFEGILTDSDQASANIRTNPADPKEFVYVNASYSAGIGNNGARLGIAGSIGETQPGGGSGRFANSDGDSRYVSVYGSYPLVRSDAGSLWINANAAYLTIEQEAMNALISEDTQVTFSVGLSSNNKLLGGRLRAGATITQGLDIFDATRNGDAFASRFDGDGVFTKGSFYINWRGRLAGNLGLHLGGYGQIANRSLLAAQEFTLGGAYSARGYDFAELSGENGFAALAELNYTINKPWKWLNRLQPYAFIDGGYVDNLDGGFGGGTLISSGLGLRANIGKLNLELESAVPLNRDRDASGDRSPHVNMRVGLEL